VSRYQPRPKFPLFSSGAKPAVTASDVQLVREGLDALAEFATYKQSSERVAECKVALDRLEAHGEGFRAEAAERERDRLREEWQRETESDAMAFATAEARVRELEAALREIAERDPNAEESPFARHVVKEFSAIARAALKQAEGTELEGERQ